jgi:hypothetical protein
MTGRLASTLLLGAVITGTALAAPGDPERRAITPADQAWARRINLTRRDVPTDFHQGPAQASGPSAFTCAKFRPDLSAFTITGQATSHTFTRAEGTSLFSSAEVFRSSHDEQADWNRSARKEALPCIASMLEQLSANGVQVKVTSSAMRPAPLGDRSISVRIVGRLSGNGIAIRTWFDIMGVARGRADATLGLISFRSAPSTALEQSLLTKVARRLAP